MATHKPSSKTQKSGKNGAKPAAKNAKQDKHGKGSESKLGSIKKLIFGEKKKPAPAASGKSKPPLKTGHVKASAPAVKAAQKPAASGKAAAPAPEVAASKGKGAVKTAGHAPSAKSKGDQPRRTSLTSSKAGQDTTGEAVCREVACEGLSTSGGYCRLHYIKNWKKIKRKELILKEGKLNQYIEELVAKYPDKYIEAIRQDLAEDKNFAKVIYDLDLDEGVDDYDMDGENVDSLIDSIKRDFDDEGEGGF